MLVCFTMCVYFTTKCRVHGGGDMHKGGFQPRHALYGDACEGLDSSLATNRALRFLQSPWRFQEPIRMILLIHTVGLLPLYKYIASIYKRGHHLILLKTESIRSYTAHRPWYNFHLPPCFPNSMLPRPEIGMQNFHIKPLILHTEISSFLLN